MDPTRAPRAVSDPKVRHVGFFTAPTTQQQPPPDRSTNSGTPDTSHQYCPSSPSHLSAGNSLSPVMIPLPCHSSPSLLPASSSGMFSPTSPAVATSFVDDVAHGRGSAKVAASDSPGGEGFDMPVKAAAIASRVPSSGLNTVSGANASPGLSGKGAAGGALVERQNDQPARSKTLREKTTKAERRAMQEAQRAAKAASKAEHGKPPAATTGVVAPAKVKAGKVVKPHLQKNDAMSAAASEKKGGDRVSEKDRKKEVPQPRMQYDDESRVEKAKKRALVKQTEAKNRVELFRHLPQYDRGTLLADIEATFFLLDLMHPAIYKVGLQFLSGDISGGNARCIAMLRAFQEAIKDYSTPPEKTLTRDLTAKMSSYISFLIECRPLSISMGNAIRFLKNRMARLLLTSSESEAKASLYSDIDRFINEKIILSEKVIVKHAVTKIRDTDVILTYGSSSAIEMVLLQAHEMGKQFRVIIVDSRPKLEGQGLLRRLVGKGVSCTYTHINAVSYIMHEVTRVFLGASSVLCNGTVYSRVGTACVAMVANEFHVPVLVCCEAYKFDERVQLDSICSNELGDPDAILKVHGREEMNFLDGWASGDKLQILNLLYDATPSEYVSMIITDYGMVPPTSVPVIVREYRREHLWL